MAALSCLTIDPVHIRTPNDALVLFEELADGRDERCGFAYLDPEWRLLGSRQTPPGTAHGVEVSLRDVIADVLALGATAVVMAHNHPGGDLSPSAADIAVTRRLVAGLEAIDVRLIDHLVIGRDGYLSMRATGLL